MELASTAAKQRQVDLCQALIGSQVVYLVKFAAIGFYALVVSARVFSGSHAESIPGQSRVQRVFRADIKGAEMSIKTRRGKIKAILQRHFLNRGPSYNPLDELRSATEAIAALPIDRTRAMTLFIKRSQITPCTYFVPDSDLNIYTVIISNGSCHINGRLCSWGNCDHVRAVKLYIAQHEQIERTSNPQQTERG